ncbi:MAG: TlpA disulfide reductase family protein [Pseudomonadota bacterium]
MTRSILSSALLYTAVVMGVNPVFAEGLTRDALLELRAGDMRKMIIHKEPKELNETPFEDVDGNPITLADYAGKTVLLNFWATWCGPCRAEMPSLDALNQEFGGEDFEVITVSSGRNPPPAVAQFFKEAGIETLPKHADPTTKFSRSMAVLGLPVTVVLDENGQEIARLQGEAEWNDEDAHVMLKALMGGDEPS